MCYFPTPRPHDDVNDVQELVEIPLVKKSQKKMTNWWIKNRADAKLFEKILADTNDNEVIIKNGDQMNQLENNDTEKELPKDFHWCAAYRLSLM